MTTRREFLLHATASLAAATLAGCTSIATPSYRRLLGSSTFPRPLIRAEDILRIRVGLRPTRAGGFVVRGERVGDKLVIHNYGHGGGGITLSWGSSTLAVRELPDLADKRAAIIGAGVMGLTTARLLQERGWQVTLYTKDAIEDTTSHIAGGQWAPTSVVRQSEETPALTTQLNETLEISYRLFSQQIGTRYGVKRIENYYLDPAHTNTSHLTRWPQYFPNIEILRRGEHPFPVGEVLRHESILIEPPAFLARLESEVREANGEIVKRAFTAREELLALPQPVIFNCSGLGAKTLFDDEALTPVRGQLVLLKPQAEIDFATHGAGDGLLYMFPRRDGLVLGGTYERGVSDLVPSEETTARILGEHARQFAAMRL